MKDVRELVDSGRPYDTDLQQAQIVELLTGAGGKVWINVDGVCLVRVAHADTVIVDTTNALSTDKVVG